MNGNPNEQPQRETPQNPDTTQQEPNITPSQEPIEIPEPTPVTRTYS